MFTAMCDVVVDDDARSSSGSNSIPSVSRLHSPICTP